MNKNYINKNFIDEIDIKVSELILTPLTCASVINEVIKCLVYHKSQIPYPYSWLKNVVNRKQNLNRQESSVNLRVQQHYNIVSTAYGVLENILYNIQTEFKNYGDDIKQVLILFGATIYTPKEIYVIKVESLAKGHLEDNHMNFNSRNQYKILRNIVFAHQWLSAMDSMIPPTNMYILLQKHAKHKVYSEDNFFQPNIHYSSTRSTTATITLNYNEQSEHNCCNNLLIFEDFCKEESNLAHNVMENCSTNISNGEDCNLIWFQARDILKGFKECFINGASATELW